MSETLKVFDVKWTSVTAGPSPDSNRRTEIFLWGCNIAAKGKPCKGCFNPKMWKVSDTAKEIDSKEMADHINKFAPNKFVTIVGGEPLDQLAPLTELVTRLKEHGFHIILFTHYELNELLNKQSDLNYEVNFSCLLEGVDVLVDGRYDETQRIYDEETGDGLHDAVGSANQVIWDIKDWRDKGAHGDIQGVYAGELAGIYVCPNGELKYIINSEEASDCRARVEAVA